MLADPTPNKRGNAMYALTLVHDDGSEEVVNANWLGGDGALEGLGLGIYDYIHDAAEAFLAFSASFPEASYRIRKADEVGYLTTSFTVYPDYAKKADDDLDWDEGPGAYDEHSYGCYGYDDDCLMCREGGEW
jgi:hypothetical protein